jgi:hypothetical protein
MRKLTQKETGVANHIMKVLEPLELEDKKRILLGTDIEVSVAETKLAIARTKQARDLTEMFALTKELAEERENGPRPDKHSGSSKDTFDYKRFPFLTLCTKEHFVTLANHVFTEWSKHESTDFFEAIEDIATQKQASMDAALEEADVHIEEMKEVGLIERETIAGMNREELLAYRAKLKERKAAIDKSRDVIDRLDGKMPSNDLSLVLLASTPHGLATLRALAYWAKSAYPQIVMGHKYAAALLVTNIGGDVVDLIKPPFESFLIEVPENLLFITKPDGTRVPIRRIIVSQYPHKDRGTVWAYGAITENGALLYRYGVSTADLLPPTIGSSFQPDEDSVFLSHSLSTEDGRVASLIGRLILGTCLTMADPEAVKKIGTGHRGPSHPAANPRGAAEPVIRTFQIGKPVVHDFRDAVARFIAGTQRSLSVQTLIAGHFRNQPCGPKLSQRKVIWISPFWRGPEDAPILVRPHMLKETKERDEAH